ncbi:Ig-like domain-containing protein, partial [Gemmata sp. JC717]|uniref:FG-GAP-like repeat-containing protein n=1 Tax=Gemmata algarum TaxID=2975278 RepID=UPI0021BB3F8B
MSVRPLWVRKFLKQWSERKRANLSKGQRASGLGVEVLEGRDVPATITLASGVLTYAAGSGVDNNISVTVSGSNFVFTDSAETIDTSVSGASGSGTNSVSIPTASITGLTLNLGDGSDTINGTGGVVVNTTNVNLVVNALDALTLAGNVNTGTGTIRILANQDGAGAQGLSQTGGTITTTNATDNALSITVNTTAGGTGSAALDSTAVGSGTTGGRLTVNSNGGSILYGTATTALSTAQQGTANSGSVPTRTLVARSYVFTAAGAGSIGTTTRPVQSLAPNDGTQVTLTAGTGGIYWTDWNKDLTVNQALAAGGDIRIVTANVGGHDLTIAGQVFTGNGNIYLAADDNFAMSAGATVGGTLNSVTFAGRVWIQGNRDRGTDGQTFTMNTDSSIVTTNITNKSVALTSLRGQADQAVYIDFEGDAGSPSAITLGNITTGDGGRIVVNSSPRAYLSTGAEEAAGRVLAASNGNLLDAGPNGTIELIGRITATTAADAIGTSATPIRVAGGSVIVNSNFGNVYVTGTAATAFTSATAANLTGQSAAVNTTLATAVGALTVAGAITVPNGGNLNLSGASGVVLAAAATTTGAGTVNITGGLTGTGSTATGTGATTVAGVLSPGTVGTTGTLTLSNPALGGTATYTADLNTTTAGTGYDQLVATGTVNLSAAPTLRLIVPATGLSVGNTFTLIDNRGSAAINGQFAGGTTVVATNNPLYTFTLNYAGGDGNDLVATLTNVAANGTLDETNGVVSYLTGPAVNTGLSVSIDGSGNYVVSDTATPITLTAGAVAAGWSVNASGVATRATVGVTGLVFNLGDGTDQVAGINAGTANVTLNGSGAQALTGVVTTTGSITVNTTGAITAIATGRLAAPTVNLTGSGIGTAAAPVQTTATTIVATAGPGGAFLAESDGASVTASATGTGDISVVNATGTLTVAGATTTVSGNITLTSGDALVLSANVNAGSGTVTLAANTDGAGTEGLSQTAGTVTTTNATDAALVVTVNTAAGGTGDASIDSAAVGSGTAGGRLSVNSNGGSILYAGTGALSDSQRGIVSGGTAPGRTLVARSYVFTATGAGSVGTDARPIQTAMPNESTSVSISAGSGGIYMTDWNGDVLLSQAVATGAGNIRVATGNATGHNLFVDGPVSTGSGSIFLGSDDDLTVNAGVTIGGAGFSGNVWMSANRDRSTNGQSIVFAPTASIVTSSTTNQDVALANRNLTTQAVYMEIGGGTTNPGNIQVGNITTGDGGRVVLNGSNLADPTQTGLIRMAAANNVLNFGTTGTLDLQVIGAATLADNIGTAALPIRVAGGNVVVRDTNGNVYVTGTGATKFVANTTTGGSLALATTAGALTVSGATGAANGGSINLNGAGGVVLAAAATTTGAGAVSITGGLTGTGSTVTGTGATTVAGVLSPGTVGTTGTLTLNNPTLDPTATFTADLNTTTAGTGYDQLVATGTVNLNGATLAVSAAPNFQVGDTFTIVSNTGTDAVVGTFASGATLAAGKYVFTINYAGGDGNDVVLTVSQVINAAPVNTLPAGPLTVAEDATLAVSGVSVSDIDAGAAAVVVTLTVAHGTLATDTTSGVTASGTGTATLTLTGALVDLNAALATLRYTPAANYFGSDTLTVTTNDQGNTGNDGPKTDTDTVGITVTEVNDAPTAADDTLPSVAEDSGPLTIPFGALTGNDSQGPANESAQSLTVTAVGNAVGGSVAIVGGTVVFTPAANFNGTAGFSYTVTDNGTTNGAADPKTSTGTVTFTITAVADTPSVTGATTSAGVQTTGGLVISRNGADGSEVSHFKITGITNGTLFLSDGVTPVTSGSFITAAQGGAGLKFTPAANFTGTGSFQVQASTGATDAGLGGDAVTATITVNAANSPPTVAATGGNVQYIEDAAATALFSGATVSAGAGLNIDQIVLTVQFAADPGFDLVRIDGTEFVLTDGTTGTTAGNGLSVSVQNNGIATITITKAGGIPASAAADLLNGLAYRNSSQRPTSGNLVDVKIVSVRDTGGATSTGAPVLTTVRVEGVNDAPVLTGSNDFTPIAEDLTSNSGVPVSALLAGHVNDVDEPGTVRGLALTGTNTANGTWEYTADGSGLNWLPVGTVSQAQALLLNTDPSTRLRFVPNANFNGTVTAAVTFRAWDQTTGAVGTKVDVSAAGGTTAFSAASGTSAITVTPVNDAPVNTVPSTPRTALTNGTVAVTGVSIADIDAGTGSVSVTFSAGAGTFAASAGGGVTVGGSGTGAITLSGTVANINALLAGGALSYTAPAVSGGVAVTVVTNDHGNSGAGGELTDTDTFTINVSARPTVALLVSWETISEIGGVTTLTAYLSAPTDVDVAVTLKYAGTATLGADFTAPTTILIPAGQISGSVTIAATADGVIEGRETIDITIDSATVATVSANPVTVNILDDSPQNQAPVHTLPGSLTTDEDVPVAFTGTNAIRVTDPDNSPGALTTVVSIAPDKGVLTATGAGVTGSGTATLTFTGTAAQINAALATLVYTPTPDGNDTTFDGATTIRIVTTDSRGGSAEDAVVVSVLPVNDPPTFTIGADQTVNEDAGAQTVNGFATGFAPGGGEVGQTAASYTVTVTATTGNLAFAVAPAVGADGTLTYTVAPNTNGTATVAVTVTDSGGATSAPRTFTITVNAVNDAPSLTLAGNVTAAASPNTAGMGLGGTYIQRNFATFAPGGGSDEQGQTPASYNLTSNRPDAFVAPPTIDGNGTLMFTLVNGFAGVISVTVTVTDSGGTANGGVATSSAQTFTITVSEQETPLSPPVPPAPGGNATGAQYIAIGTDSGTLGTVRVLSAGTRAPVRDIVPFQGYNGGLRVALGDVNGDGREDLIVGTANVNSHVKVFDIVTGAELRSFIAFSGFAGGVDIAAGDVTGDGKSDIVVGAGAGAAGGHVKVFDGATGAELRSFFAFPGFTGGVKVGAGDLTGDGKAEVVVLAGPGGNGHIKAFDGVTGAAVTSFLGYTGYAGEVDLAVGDADGNGLDEIVTAAQNPTSGTHIKAFDKDARAVRSFFAPLPGDPLQRSDQFPALPPGTTARIAIADFTGDNVADYLLGSPPGAGTSWVLLLNGASGAVVENRHAFDPTYGLGVY